MPVHYRLNIRYTYATSGLQIYAIDMQEGKEEDVDRFPTPDELWEMTFLLSGVRMASIFWQNNLSGICLDLLELKYHAISDAKLKFGDNFYHPKYVYRVSGIKEKSHSLVFHHSLAPSLRSVGCNCYS